MKTITVGRSEACDIIINEPNISRIHAEISFSEGKYIFRDVSTNGSSVNGRSIVNSEVIINSNCSILLAHSIPLYWSRIEALLPASGGNPISGNKTEFSQSYESSDSTPNYSQKKQGMFSNSFSFEGRIRRLEYGLSIIIYFAASFIIGLILGATVYSNGMSVEEDKWILYVSLIPVYWFGLAQGSKRCHDRGNSGWYQIIPFYGLWMAFAEGDNGINEYGPNPKN
jgi:uncharacterized membrane protein YhaH (DUF805 family)